MSWIGIDTGSGVWNAAIFVLFFIIGILIAYIIRSTGIRGYRKRMHAGEPFYFGNEVPETGYIKASNIYWGFFKAMERYYRPVVGEHTGNLNDYMAWLVLSMAGLLLVLFFA